MTRGYTNYAHEGIKNTGKGVITIMKYWKTRCKRNVVFVHIIGYITMDSIGM